MLKLLSCNVFMREACLCIAASPHTIDVEFFEVGEHVHSNQLRTILQARIDATEAGTKQYEAILLLYGLCGNSTVGLTARKTKLVIPRAHDCCTILLGSRDRFREHFEPNPSQPFSSVGYMERGEYYLRTDDGEHSIHYGDAYAAYVEQYGEENAKYIWESMHPPQLEQANRQAVFIDLKETAHLGFAEKFRATAEKDGKEYLRLEGSLELIRRFINGQWDDGDFLTVQPGEVTAGVYDWTRVIRAAPPKP